MLVDEIIAQLKAFAPLFAGNVAGGADWELAQDQVWLPQPAAYVIPVEDEAAPNANQTGLRQVVTQTVGIIVDLDNSADRRGQGAATLAVRDVRRAIWAAVLNWRPPDDHASRGYQYVRGGYLRSNRARLIWQFDFSNEIYISHLDGFQLPAAPLTVIQTTLSDAQTGVQAVAFDAPLPQS